jgi:hypothetical protein
VIRQEQSRSGKERSGGELDGKGHDVIGTEVRGFGEELDRKGGDLK